ncbi:uncharacterized protein [Pseudorasbora parva]|uniref:uncharacterized protein n=1 Tax=Pseudorasbora parva TaxID=51549 RepID=UPI00351F4E4D
MTSASGSPGSNTGTNRPPPAPTVNNEMTRSFPGLFLKKQGKRRFPETKSIRTVSIQFFLLPEHTDRTPKGSEELRLLQAGLGRRVVSLPENATHKEIVSILEEEYHKIKQLAGGWLCYKASGGCGQRKLTVVPPDSEGYSTKCLKAASSNGKITIYIVPLQDTIDSTPLSPDAAVFEKMPKSVCKKCGVTMPLQVLALHIDNCAQESENASEESPDEDIIYVSEEKKIKSSMELCPVCGGSFPEDMMEFHASICVDNCSREMENFSEWTEDAVAASSYSREGGENAASEQPEVVQPSNSREGGGDAVAGPSNRRGDEDAVAGPSNRRGDEDAVAGPSPEREDWRNITDPKVAAEVFKTQLLNTEVWGQPLRFMLDLREDLEDQDREIISFYKRPNINWSRPFSCILRVLQFYMSYLEDQQKLPPYS